LSSSTREAVAAHRRRLKDRGLVRVEVRVPKQDATLLRDIAGALADPTQGAQTRRLLREQLAPPKRKGLKELLASAPLDLELDFDRSRDTSREIEL
jgi:hypothetical protein